MTRPPRYVLVLVLGLAMAGCPEGGDGSDTNEPPAPDTTQLPDTPTVETTGIIGAPSGRSPSDYEVGNDLGDGEVDAAGRFVVPIRTDGVTITLATPRAAGEDDTNVLIALTANVRGEPGLDGVVVSPESTAVALTFLSPAHLSRDVRRLRAVLAVAPSLPAVQILTERVRATWGANPQPMALDGFEADYTAAIEAVLAALPSPAPSADGGPAGTNRVDGHHHRLDHVANTSIEVDYKAGKISVATVGGNPLASILRLSELDLDGEHALDWGKDPITERRLLQSAHDVDKLKHRPMCQDDAWFFQDFEEVGDSFEYGNTSGESYLQYVDIAGALIIDPIFEGVTSAVKAKLGWTDDDTDASNVFTVDPNRPAVYVLRSFNGKLHSSTECGEYTHSLGFRREAEAAGVMNIVMNAFDGLAFVVDVRDYARDCVVEAIEVAYEDDITAAADAAGNGTTASRGSWWSRATKIGRVAARCVGNALDDLIESGATGAAEKIARKSKRLVRVLDSLWAKLPFEAAEQLAESFFKLLNPFGYAAVGGTILDRLWVLFYGNSPLLTRRPVTPMDTYVVRVGDPFAPFASELQVEDKAATDVTTAQADKHLVKIGQTVHFTGKNFRRIDPAVMHVRFTDRAHAQRTAEATITSDTEASVIVPEGLADLVTVDLLSVAGVFSLGEVLVIEPEIDNVYPTAMFIVARGGDGAPTYDVGDNYTPEVALTGQGFNPNRFVAHLTDAAGAVMPLVPDGTTDRVIHLGEPSAAAGVYELVLDTKITAKAFTDVYPGGIFPTGVSLSLVPAPIVDSVSPAEVADGELMIISGANFGELLGAVSLEVEITAEYEPIHLEVDRLSATAETPAGLRVQPGTLATRFRHLVLQAWKEGQGPASATLTTPAGQVTFDIPLGEEILPTHRRTVTVNDATKWQDAAKIVTGTYTGDDLKQEIVWAVTTTQGPSGPESRCDPDPAVGAWGLDQAADPLNPLAVSRPPGTKGSGPNADGSGGYCRTVCKYDAFNWSQPVNDGETLPYDAFNDVQGLPTTPCPWTWQGVAPGDVHDGLRNELADFNLTPTSIVANWLDVRLDIKSGGGLELTGFDGNSHLTGEITIAEPSSPGGTTPVVTLRNLRGGTLSLDLDNASSCAVGVKITAAKDIFLDAPVITGCKIGVEIIDSEGVIIRGGKIKEYGDDGVGVRIVNSKSVRVIGTDIRAYPSSSGVSPSARGIVVEGGSQGVRLRPAGLRSNRVGIEVKDASQVAISGRVGLPLDDSDPGTSSGNAIGVDLVGPATQITIGDNPAVVAHRDAPNGYPEPPPFVTTVANNGRDTEDGAGIRVQDVVGLTVSRAYVGVVPPHADEGNRVGIQLVGQPNGRPTNVRIERSHLGDNHVADVEAIGVVGLVTLRDNLFAGPRRAGWTTPADFPVTDPGFEATGSCMLEALPGGFDPNQAPAFEASARFAPGVLIRGGSKGLGLLHNAFIGAGIRVEESAQVVGQAIRMRGAVGPGITVKDSVGCRFVDTEVWVSSEAGVLLDGAAATTFQGCSAANVGAGLEATGAPVNAAVGNVVGRRTPPETGSVIVDPLDPAAKWQHLNKQLADGAASAVFYGNQTHGVYAHDGAIPLAMTETTVASNAVNGVLIADYEGAITLARSAVGLKHLDGVADVAMGNGAHGVEVLRSDASVAIGLGQKGDGNVISANTGAGIRVDTAHAVAIKNTYVGASSSGDAAFANKAGGVDAKASDNLVIGGPGPFDGNLVSGNLDDGIRVDAAGVSFRTQIRGNFVGVTRDGAAGLGNGGAGIHAVNCDVDFGAPRIVGNLVADNEDAGILVGGCFGHAEIADNTVGGVIPPAVGRPFNRNAQIQVTASAHVDVHSNEVSGGTTGIMIVGSERVRVAANTIGGASSANVGLDGSSRECRVVDNVITGGTGVGVRVAGLSIRNLLSNNSITGHGGAGIDLDGGGNEGIVAPTVDTTDRNEETGHWRIAGTAQAPNGSRIEVFADPDREARVPLLFAATSVWGGKWHLSAIAEPPPAALAPQKSLDELTMCATVTDPWGNTSELGCDAAPANITCDLGEEPPGDSAGLAGGIVTSRGDGFYATGVDDGVSVALSDLSPGGGEAVVCGSLVAFSGGEVGARDIYVRDLIAETTTQLTTDAGDDVEPSFDPSCSVLAFASNRGGAWDLFTITAAGSDLHQITDDAAEDRSPTYRPDAQVLVFSRKPPAAVYFELYSTDGDEVTALTTGDGDAHEPVFHPVDGRVAYSRCQGARCGVEVIDLATRSTRALGAPACEDRSPAWLVDGDRSWLLVSRRTAGTENRHHVVLLNEAGTVQWRVTPMDTDDHAPACCLE